MTDISPITSTSNHAPSIKLIAIDLDGTVVGQSNTIREPVKRTLQAVQAQGVKVVIATGRMFHSALRFNEDIRSNLPLICYQGALIKDPVNAKVHRHWRVPGALVQDLLDYLEHPTWRSQLSIHVYIDDQLYVREISAASYEYSQRSQTQLWPVGDLRTVLQDQEPTKVLALAQTPSLSETLFHNLKQRYSSEQLYLTQSVSTFLEATHPKVNKGEAVRYVAEELLGITAAEVMTIGDNFNDLEMIEYAGIGVAMGDAPDAVKAVANFVVPGVEADGVVAAVEKFVL